ncbi:MAG: hypothetical protein WBG50_13135 [Desulfomonilaceae bacterium]
MIIYYNMLRTIHQAIYRKIDACALSFIALRLEAVINFDFTMKSGEPMARSKIGIILVLATLLAVGTLSTVWGGQVGIKCHITCRCLQDNTVGNFAFIIPVDQTPDTGYDADLACFVYGNRVCSDGCNGLKFSYTYQTTSP